MKTVVCVLVTSFAMMVAGPCARANTVVFTWSGTDTSDHYNLLGQATFGVSNYNPITGACLSGGCDLTIDIENTGAEVTSNPDMLSGLFFNIKEGTTSNTGGVSPGVLDMASATATDGEITSTGKTPTGSGQNICAPAGGNSAPETCSSTVTGGWEATYKSGGWSGPIGSLADWGIGTASFWSGGSPFQSSSVGQLNYSIVPTSGTSDSQQPPYVYFKADFVLTGLTSSSIYVNYVQADYGTGPNYAPGAILVSGEAPEPRTVALISGALLLMLLKRRRKA